MIVVTTSQRTPEWLDARLGHVTSSRASDLLATLKSGKGEAAGRRNYRLQLVLERITGRSQETGFVSAAMQQGTDREAAALARYEALTGNLLQATGFIAHDTLLAGCSPDGVIHDYEGIAEIKCPQPATHWEYLKTGRIPTEYAQQIVHALWITGAAWCDWLSYNPDFPPSLQTKLVRLVRDEAEVASYELLVRQFLTEVDAETQAVLAMAAA